MPQVPDSPRQTFDTRQLFSPRHLAGQCEKGRRGIGSTDWLTLYHAPKNTDSRPVRGSSFRHMSTRTNCCVPKTALRKRGELGSGAFPPLSAFTLWHLSRACGGRRSTAGSRVSENRPAVANHSPGTCKGVRARETGEAAISKQWTSPKVPASDIEPRGAYAILAAGSTQQLSNKTLRNCGTDCNLIVIPLGRRLSPCNFLNSRGFVVVCPAHVMRGSQKVPD